MNKFFVLICTIRRLMFPIAATDASATGPWLSWSLGAKRVEGSAAPFHSVMSVVQECKQVVNQSSSMPHMDAYRLLCTQRDRVRGLLLNTYPAWTHRMQSTQHPLPDAREEYVYGLYCACAGLAYGHLADAIDAAAEAAPEASAQAHCNAAHLCHVAARLTATEDLVSVASVHRVSMLRCTADALHRAYESGASSTGIGAACGMMALAVQCCEQTGMDAQPYRDHLRCLRAQNAAGECESETVSVEQLPALDMN